MEVTRGKNHDGIHTKKHSLKIGKDHNQSFFHKNGLQRPFLFFFKKSPSNRH